MSSSTTTTQAMIDWPQADAILGTHDRMMREIYDEFLESQPEDIQALLDCIHEGAEAGEIRASAHRLKGAVLNFGMARVAEVIEEIERLAFDEQFDALPEIAATIEPLFVTSAMLIEKKYPRAAF